MPLFDQATIETPGRKPRVSRKPVQGVTQATITAPPKVMIPPLPQTRGRSSLEITMSDGVSYGYDESFGLYLIERGNPNRILLSPRELMEHFVEALAFGFTLTLTGDDPGA